MNRNIGWNWRERVPSWVLVLLAIVIISVLVRILPYLVHDYFFEIGFDTGIYERLSSFYLLGLTRAYTKDCHPSIWRAHHGRFYLRIQSCPLVMPLMPTRLNQGSSSF